MNASPKKHRVAPRLLGVFRFLLAGKECAQAFGRSHVFVEDVLHMFRDRQFDADALGEANHFVDGDDTFDNLSDVGDRLRQRDTASEGDAEPAIA